MRKSHGFTLAELMITVAIIGVFFCFGIFGLRAMMSGDSVEKEAEAEVRVYAAKLNLKVDGIACGNITTKNGNVSCTLRSGDKTHQLECIGRYSVGHGCRDQKLSVPATTE